MAGRMRRAPYFKAIPSALLLGCLSVGCGPKTAAEAEAKHDVKWLEANPTGESIAALGRLADTDDRAVKALEARAKDDVNVHIAAWTAITRSAAWGTTFMRASLADPDRAEMAASTLPRKDARIIPLVGDLEGAMTRFAGSTTRGTSIAGILASLGPAAHAAIERRLVDPKTRNLMCEGIALPEASGDAKSTLLAVPIEARDSPSCVNVVINMAATEDVVINWIATGGEPGLISAASKSSLECPRVAMLWKKALMERTPDAALTVPLKQSVARCGPAMDPALAELLEKAPRARPSIIQAIDPFDPSISSLAATCAAFKAGYANGESPILRERAQDALQFGCAGQSRK